MRKVLLILLGAPLLTTAAIMIAMPEVWYANLPGVAERGSFNAHFVRDIGCAFLVAASSFLSGAFLGRRAYPAVLAATAFLALHAGIHLWESLGGHWAASSRNVFSDAVFVYTPALLACAAA